jgi:sensor histidine kinase regulating citrate/malate metabolism
MLKNALEASLTEEIITIGCDEVSTDNLCFWVHNPQYLRADVRDKIFSRSFSTKGNGRGIGTYSIKLIGERYLKGSVTFTSSIDTGTTFSITLPRLLKI